MFRAGDSEHGHELWATDGTPEGTTLVKDIVEGSASSFPASLVDAGETIYLAATDREHGRELWVSDGTGPGTRLVQDLAPGPISSSPEELTLVGDQLFFTADDFVSGLGYELWALPLAEVEPVTARSGVAPLDPK